MSSAIRSCVLSLSLALGACSVLDADRLSPVPARAGSSGNSGSGGLGGTMAGRGGHGGSGMAGVDAAGGTGGIGGAGGAGGTGGAGGLGGDSGVDDPDAGDGTRCGDGLVTGTELCDTAIADDEPGACPSACPPLSECVMRALNGTGCRAECVVLQAQCEDGDGCCPGNCMTSNDDDCSAKCGDGIVQEAEQETCEPEPSEQADAGASARCPEDCDDNDDCTMDVMSGSAMNCNVECDHVAITALAAGDSCCPDGANTLTDADCDPVCGNGVRERGEDCDAPTGCNAECDIGYTADQRRCLDTFAITNDACALCECTSCTANKLACFDDSDADRGALCVELQACVRPSGCFDAECYCGDSFGCLAPNGPCVPEVERAAETTDALEIDMRKMNTNYAVGRSWVLDNCVASQCAAACQ